MQMWNPDTPPHTRPPGVGVLVTNLGTPDAPTTAAVRRYLRQFLSDHRVIDLPRWKWLPILNLFVLTTRPKKSAALYRQIWTEEGSPLLTGTRSIATELERRLSDRFASPVATEVGMRYGNPSIPSALRRLAERGCNRILTLPLYPHYSASSTASTFDAIFAELATWRRQPELRTIHSFHDEPGHIACLAASVRELWRRDGEPEKILFSYHGIPRRYFDEGDPYHCLCRKTSRLLAEALQLEPHRHQTSFQSLFGKEEWLKPYTDATIGRLGAEGLSSLDVLCPGFSIDCLETLEEIDGLNRRIFTDAGGGCYRFIPCLNDRPDHLQFLEDLSARHLQGWEFIPTSVAEERIAETAARARALSTKG
jgi:ferrochelatase